MQCTQRVELQIYVANVNKTRQIIVGKAKQVDILPRGMLNSHAGLERSCYLYTTLTCVLNAHNSMADSEMWAFGWKCTLHQTLSFKYQ